MEVRSVLQLLALTSLFFVIQLGSWEYNFNSPLFAEPIVKTEPAFLGQHFQFLLLFWC